MKNVNKYYSGVATMLFLCLSVVARPGVSPMLRKRSRMALASLSRGIRLGSEVTLLRASLEESRNEQCRSLNAC